MLGRLIGPSVTLVVDLGRTVGALLADRSQLEQVLVNLVVNSRDAMTAGGTITIGVAEVTGTPSGVALPQFVRITVKDDGHGMDEAVRARMFEPFFTTRPGKGTGLGLATVYGIVDHGGGHIEVESAPGSGTKVAVFFPKVDGPFDAEPVRAQATGPLRGHETILLADDSEQVRTVVGEILRRNGYDVIAVRDGAEALAVCRSRSGRIDLLLTDVMMPGMSGWELGARVSELRPSTSILHMSSFAPDTPTRESASERVEFIAKPFTAETLLRKLRALLDRGGTKIAVGGVRVLYVDDEEALGMLVKRALGRLGHAVTTFADAHDALAAFTRAPGAFDVVVVDLRMPKMSGFALASAMRRLRAGMPTVLVSGVVTPDDVIEAERAGLSLPVTKAVSIDELATTLDAAVRAAK